MVVPVAISISYNNSKSRTNLLFYNYTNSICWTVKLFASSDSNNGISGTGDGMINGKKERNKGISAHYKLADSIGEGGIDLRDNWEAICPANDDTMRTTDSFNGVIDGNNKKIIFASTKEGLFENCWVVQLLKI